MRCLHLNLIEKSTTKKEMYMAMNVSICMAHFFTFVFEHIDLYLGILSMVKVWFG